MGKIKIIGTGLSGMVGSRIVELLNDQYDFENLSLETGVDITDKKSVINILQESDAPIVVHLAAKADVDGCERDKEKDSRILKYQNIRKQEEEWRREKTAWYVNVLGTKNLTEACAKTGKKLIYVSTDFIFDGEKEDGYAEEDNPNPINWYGKTKYEGEKIVQSLNSYCIMRLAYPYRASFGRNDFVRRIILSLKNKESLQMVTDHFMTPTFIDDFAGALDILIKTKSQGIFHAVGSQFVTPYKAALLIAKVFGFNPSLISKTTREEFFKDRAKRPFYLKIKNAKISGLGSKMLEFEEGLKRIKKHRI